MAYTATVSVEDIGPGEYYVIIDETDCGPADEAAAPGLPNRGTVLRQVVQLISGTATTVDPIAGWEPNPGGINVIVQVDAPASAPDFVDIEGTATYYNELGTGQLTLYHRSRPDAGNDNVIQTRYHIQDGW